MDQKSCTDVKTKRKLCAKLLALNYVGPLVYNDGRDENVKDLEAAIRDLETAQNAGDLLPEALGVHLPLLVMCVVDCRLVHFSFPNLNSGH